MCSESVWWRCHRRLLADHLVLVRGIQVVHLMHDGRLTPHMRTEGVRLADDARSGIPGARDSGGGSASRDRAGQVVATEIPCLSGAPQRQSRRSQNRFPLAADAEVFGGVHQGQVRVRAVREKLDIPLGEPPKVTVHAASGKPDVLSSGGTARRRRRMLSRGRLCFGPVDTTRAEHRRYG